MDTQDVAILREHEDPNSQFSREITKIKLNGKRAVLEFCAWVWDVAHLDFVLDALSPALVRTCLNGFRILQGNKLDQCTEIFGYRQ